MKKPFSLDRFDKIEQSEVCVKLSLTVVIVSGANYLNPEPTDTIIDWNLQTPGTIYQCKLSYRFIFARSCGVHKDKAFNPGHHW